MRHTKIKFELEISNVLTNFWLKNSNQDLFHAYLSIKTGSKPVCGDNSLISDIQNMDIPGDRTICCLECMNKLYGLKIPPIF